MPSLNSSPTKINERITPIDANISAIDPNSDNFDFFATSSVSDYCITIVVQFNYSIVECALRVEPRWSNIYQLTGSYWVQRRRLTRIFSYQILTGSLNEKQSVNRVRNVSVKGAKRPSGVT